MPYLRSRSPLVCLLVLILSLTSIGGRIAQARTITGFLTFETGSDSAVIALPGISFVNATGSSWQYGDVRTRQYNAPYPQSCTDRPAAIATPTCQYAVGENFFAWTGVIGGAGRFEFTQGDASFVTFDLATGSRASVLAYNATDRPIAAASAQADSKNGNRASIQLDAPAGERIAYVVISGITNFWLLDNLATDAPGVPDQRPFVDRPRAEITVVQRVSLPVAVVPGDSITLMITAVNRGRGTARETLIHMPFDSTRVRVLDASFSAPGAWVSRLGTDELELKLGSLGSNGGVLTSTIRLAILDNAPEGGALGQQLSFRWADNASGGHGRSNTLNLGVGTTSSVAATLDVTPVIAPAGTERVAMSTSFAPHEPVSLWYNTPEGKATELGRYAANDDGALSVAIDSAELRAGEYSLVAYGHWTEFTSVASFTVQ